MGIAMDVWGFFRDAIFGGAFYDVLKGAIGALIVTALTIPPLKYVFGLLKDMRETIVYSISTFLIVVIVFSFVGARPLKPNFVGSIQSVTVGNGNEITGQVVVLPVLIVNNGTMQSIATNWKVTASHNGTVYTAQFVPMPESFTFRQKSASASEALGITYHNSDVIVGKLSPIPPGGALAGILFVSFPNVDPSLFKAGPEYQVSFNDVLGKSYTLALQGTANIGKLSLVPGLHMDAICPTPPAFQGKQPSGAFSPAPKN